MLSRGGLPRGRKSSRSGGVGGNILLETTTPALSIFLPLMARRHGGGVTAIRTRCTAPCFEFSRETVGLALSIEEINAGFCAD